MASLGYINLDTLIGPVIIQIISFKMSFILYLADIDKLDMFLNNVIIKFIYDKFVYPVVGKYDHTFFM